MIPVAPAAVNISPAYSNRRYVPASRENRKAITVFRWINLGVSRAKLRATRKRFTLTFSQMLAASLGLFSYLFFGPGYLSGGVAMISAITLMILFNTVHPPAVSTSLSFAFRTGDVNNYTLFGMAVAMTAILVILEQAALRIIFRFKKQGKGNH